MPLDIIDGALDIGITDPHNIEAFDALQFISGKIGMPYKNYAHHERRLRDRVLDAYQNLSGEVEKALSEYEMDTKSSEVEFSHEEKVPILNEETPNLSGRNETLQEDAPSQKSFPRYCVMRLMDIHPMCISSRSPHQDTHSLSYGR